MRTGPHDSWRVSCADWGFVPFPLPRRRKKKPFWSQSTSTIGTSVKSPVDRAAFGMFSVAMDRFMFRGNFAATESKEASHLHRRLVVCCAVF
jgi:hypothetical protein